MTYSMKMWVHLDAVLYCAISSPYKAKVNNCVRKTSESHNISYKPRYNYQNQGSTERNEVTPRDDQRWTQMVLRNTHTWFSFLRHR